MGDLQDYQIEQSITQFDTLVADNTVNKADIGSHYDHSPERHRLYINGSRFQLQYDTTSKFEDTRDSYTLKPAAGDVMTYKSAERFRYVVGYILEVSQALSVNQELTGDDVVVIGYGDIDLVNDRASADGWFIEFNSGHGLKEGDLLIYRDGVEKVRQTVDFNRDYTEWKRYAQDLSWYNVGGNEVTETYTFETSQVNDEVGSTEVTGDKATITGNHRVTFAVEADSSTTGLELDCGSIGVQVLGNASPLVRAKSYTASGSHSGSGEWEPVHAFRVDPSRDRVNTQLTSMQAMKVSADTDVRLMAMAFDPSKTDLVDGDFSTPPEHNSDNSVVEVADDADVTQFPDASGTLVGSTLNPGGYQLGYASRYVAGTGTNQRRSESARVRKRNIYNGDFCVVLANADSAVDVTFEVETEQDW